MVNSEPPKTVREPLIFNERYIEKHAEKVTEEQIEKVEKKAESIRARFLRMGPLGKFLKDGELAIGLVKDYRSGVYPHFPRRLVASVVFALLYILNPFDLVPDVLPLLGMVDDAMVFGACLGLVDKELRRYGNWKSSTAEKGS